MPGPVVLLTDFGLSDPYAGQLRGAVLRHAPHATIVDLCHHVAPHDILQAAFFLQASRSAFGDGAIFVCVVDPEVGGPRRMILAQAHEQFFLAPDNGLVSLVLAPEESAALWDVTPSDSPASATFHGRDILAPLAARLVLGVPPGDLGHPVALQSLIRLEAAAPFTDGQRLHARVLHVDRFGNCILNLPTAGWHGRCAATGALALIEPSNASLKAVAAYRELPPGQPGILRGSQGYLELSMNRESAADRFGLIEGDPVTLFLGRAE